MNRTFICAGFGFLFFLGLGVPEVQAQQPAAAEPQTLSGTVQAPREVVPALPVPRLVKFAGALNDEQGKPRTGVVGVTFAIYKEQEGGAALWLETQNVDLDEQGHYTVLLGASKSEGLPLELFTAGEPRWLGVQVNLPREVEQPRVLLVSVPYALKAADADTLGGKPLSSFVLTSSASGGGVAVSSMPNANPVTGAATIGGGGSPNVVAKFDSTGANVINSSITDDGSRVTVGEGINFGSDFSFVGNAEPASTGIVQIFNRANVGFVLRGLNLLMETLQGSSFTPTEVMRWTQAGNVGIHTSAPTAPLEVAGNLKVSGAGNAIIFPNGTVMSSAATGVGGGTITGVAAGTGLTGGGTAGGVTLGIDPSVVPQLGAANTFTGNQTVSGNLTATSFSGNGANLTNVNAATLGGLAASGFAQLGASNTFTANQLFGLATFSGNNSSQVLHVQQNGIGTPGISSSAVWGEAVPTAGNVLGVLGTTVSTAGIGVMGESENSIGNGIGVFGRSDSSLGIAGLFHNIPGGNILVARTGSVGATSDVFTVNGNGDVNATGTITSKRGALADATGTGIPILTVTQNAIGSTLVLNSQQAVSANIVDAQFSGTSVFHVDGQGSVTANSFRDLATGKDVGLLLTCATNQIMKWNGTAWACSGTGTVTSVGSGLGLVGGPITGSGSLAIDPTVVPQLTASSNAFTGSISALSVGIGTATPTHTLEVVAGGTTLADAWTVRSSRRWKSNIQPLVGALEKVQHLRGVSYDQKEDGKHQIGVIAEEVGQVLPEIVNYEKNGVDAQGVDYARLTALLIEATKEEQQEITALRGRAKKQDRDVQALKQQNARLREQLRAISVQLEHIHNQMGAASVNAENAARDSGSGASALVSEASAHKSQPLP